MTEADVEAALSTVDEDVEEVVAVGTNIVVRLPQDVDVPRNIICIDADGKRWWRVADHPDLETSFYSVHYDDRIEDTRHLYGFTYEESFIIDPATGELEFHSIFR